MYRSRTSGSASKYHPPSAWMLALTLALAGVAWSGTARAAGEDIRCYVYDDNFQNMAGPSDAIYVAGSGRACIPDGTPTGICRKWFGMCTAVGTTPEVGIWFRVFNDGYTDPVSSQSVYIPEANQACIPDGSPRGTCRRWFGLVPQHVISGRVRCRLFDDGYSSVTSYTDAIYFRQDGQVCMPDGTATGICRKWFGLCRAL